MDESKPDKIPYREGDRPPGPDYIVAKVVERDGKDTGMFWVKASTIQGGGPLHHEDVDALLPIIRWQYRHLKPFLTWCPSFEQWERGFLQDTHPGREIALWTRATYAFLEFVHREPHTNKEAVFAGILGLLVGRDDMLKPKSVTQKLKRLMGNPAEILADAANFTEDGRLKAREPRYRHLR